MKFLVIGDPHFRVDNVQETEVFIQKITELAKLKSPDVIVILGDVLHTHERIHTIPLNLAYTFVDEMRKITLTYVMVGNHDMISCSQFLTTNHWMNALKEWKNVVVVDNVKDIDDRFFFCPYVENGRFIEALNTSNKDWKKADLIFAHQEFFGCKMGGIISESGDKWDETYPHVISGHIHSKQTLKNIFYTGSAMQHAFGESEDNIILFVNDNSEFEEIDLGLSRKRIVYVNLDTDFKIPKTEDKLKVSIDCDYESFKAFKNTLKYDQLIQSGVKVVFKPKKNTQQEDVIDYTESNFSGILNSIILNEKNTYLYSVYESIVNGKDIDPNNIMFL